MMNAKLIFNTYFCISLIFCSLAFSAETNEIKFNESVTAFQSKKFTESGAKLDELIKESPNDPTLLFNRGVVAFYEGKLGLSLAAFRKSMHQKTFAFEERKYIEKIEPMLEKGQLSFPNLFNAFPFYFLSLEVFILISLGLFILATWLVLKYLGKRRMTSEEIDLPFPWLASAFGAATVVLLIITFLKFQNLNDQLGTVIQNNSALKTQISAESPTITELPEGLEVKILQIHQDWIQVSHPNYSVGWVKKSDIF